MIRRAFLSGGLLLVGLALGSAAGCGSVAPSTASVAGSEATELGRAMRSLPPEGRAQYFAEHRGAIPGVGGVASPSAP